MELYPVTVTVEGEPTVTKAKVFASLDRTVVYYWPDGDPEPTVLIDEARAPERARQANTWTLQLHDGKVATLRQGCGGCNPSRLRRWQPVAGAVRTETATSAPADA